MSTRAKIAAATASAGVLLIGWQIGVQPANGSATTPTTGTASAGTSAQSSSAAPSRAPSTAPSASASAGSATSTKSSGYADGTFIGSITSNEFGQWQVTVTVASGKITKVEAATSAQDGHSSRINSQAVPMLRTEVLAAQSADVDLVSGATLTSQSYLTSLQSALDQAVAA